MGLVDRQTESLNQRDKIGEIIGVPDLVDKFLHLIATTLLPLQGEQDHRLKLCADMQLNFCPFLWLNGEIGRIAFNALFLHLVPHKERIEGRHAVDDLKNFQISGIIIGVKIGTPANMLTQGIEEGFLIEIDRLPAAVDIPLVIGEIQLGADAVGYLTWLSHQLGLGCFLDIDDVIAHLMVSEGFVTISEIAEASLEELMSIEGFDEEISSELSQRAKNFVKIESERIETALKKLKVKEDLYNFSDLSKSSILTLAESNIKSLDDLAELDSEELFNLLGDKIFVNEDDAGSVIMKARQHWFAEEKVDD